MYPVVWRGRGCVQIRNMAQSRLRLCGEARSLEEQEFMQFGALKMIYMEQVSWCGCYGRNR